MPITNAAAAASGPGAGSCAASRQVAPLNAPRLCCALPNEAPTRWLTALFSRLPQRARSKKQRKGPRAALATGRLFHSALIAHSRSSHSP